MNHQSCRTTILPFALLLGACGLESIEDVGGSGEALLIPGDEEDESESETETETEGETGSDGSLDVCGDGIVGVSESCDDAGESALCDSDCTFPECGDGYLNMAANEECDDHNQDNTDDCTGKCEVAFCGDGYVWEGEEECDVANAFQPCNEDCTSDACYWDIDAVPLPVEIHDGSEYGQIAFDRNCDLVITGEHTQQLYRLSQVDGSVSTVGNIAADSINGLTAHPDGRLYVAVSLPDEMWALETDDSLTKIADLPVGSGGMTTAPATFGGFGGHLIWGSMTRKVYATNPADGNSTLVGGIGGNGIFSDVSFAPDGTLYTLDHSTSRVYTLTAGGVIALFADLPSVADGLRVNPAGTQLHVASYAVAASIDSLSLPGAVVTQGPDVMLNGGGWPTGMLFDSSGRLLYLTRITIAGGASIDSFVP